MKLWFTKKIEQLQAENAALGRDIQYARNQRALTEAVNKELHARMDTCCNLHKELQEMLEDRTTESDNFRVEANDLRVTTAALNQENADLVYQLELYRSVLKQLNVPVKLPARSKQ